MRCFLRVSNLLFGVFATAPHLLAGDFPTTPSQPNYGTSAPNVLTISAPGFTPWSSDDGYVTYTVGSRRPTSGTGAFVAPVSLPSGALVKDLVLIGCDESTSGGISAALWVGRVSNLDDGNELLRVDTNYSGAPGCSGFPVAASVPITIDNDNETYWVIVWMDAFAPSLRFQGVRLHYKLQMSPPPAVATFGDVPKNHPYFRAVEALAASGITGGCGNGNFCPDLPVTRGALAKFLANALGLHWGVAEPAASASEAKERP